MRKIKKISSIFLAVGIMISLFGCSSAQNETTGQQESKQSSQYPFEILDTKEPIKAEIEMEDGGIIALELDPETAPITVSNFVYLAKKGFYDGLTFHRVIEGFMVQGGDPQGNGTGGPGYTIKGEFSNNGVKNNIKHERGVISMARTNDMNGGGSQFFIMHANNESLNGNYAAFGKVTSGMDIVDKIANVQTDSNDKPLKPVVMKTIRILE